jgi:UDP-N-acetylmuramoyl-L-alanyl-D-glutamate--2,6-diaminopimelate ligase
MPPDTVTLGRLASLLGVEVTGDASVTVHDVHHDSRAVTPGSLFVAIAGATADGHEFVPQAAAAGADGLVLERAVPTDLPYFLVADARRALPICAVEVHGHPAERLTTVGVTGTNGKTTVTYLLEAIASAAGLRPAMLGTVGGRIGNRPVPLGRTTPESSDLQRLLARMVADATDLVALEVSSHALRMGRVDGVRFDVAAFTNLSRDHLDFHRDMDDYYDAKRSLFAPARAEQAVINIDDPWGRRLAGEAGIPVLTVGAGAEVAIGDVRPDAAGTTFTLRADEQAAEIRLGLVGAFNASNAAVAAAGALATGIGFASVVTGLEAAGAVPGRFQRVDGGQDFAVIVDYAHTPDAVAIAIAAARQMAARRVIAVLGAGGDRDRAKRAGMGAALAAADVGVVTADNPRREDPAAINAAVIAGAVGGEAQIVEIPDRETAIEFAVGIAEPGDIVLVLGKGHEQGQEMAGRMVPFDDAAVAAAAVAKAAQ